MMSSVASILGEKKVTDGVKTEMMNQQQRGENSGLTNPPETAQGETKQSHRSHDASEVFYAPKGSSATDFIVQQQEAASVSSIIRDLNNNISAFYKAS